MANRKAGMAFIFTTITLDMIGLGLIIPSLPSIMQRFLSDPTEIAAHYGYFVSIYAAMQFLASPLLGALSDVFGRKPILLISLVIAGLDYLLMAFAPTLPLLFAGRVVSGLTGANVTVAMAYIADISTDKNRSANFGLIGAAFGLGFILGPALGGLLGNAHAYLPFLVAAGLNLANFLFGLFVLPESNRVRDGKLQWAKINPFQSLATIFRSNALIALLIVYFLSMLAGQTHPSVWVLYTQTRFNWHAAEVGLSLALVGLLSAFVQAGLTRVLVPRLGEFASVLLSNLGLTIAYVLFGLANEGWMMYAILGGSAVFWVGTPALQSLITSRATSQAQGELQGTLVSLSSLASIINPLAVTQLFSYFTSTRAPFHAPGAPYFLAGFMSALAFVVSLVGGPGKKARKK